ncbi:penicillin-binding transpeptidase domain-containing protein [Herbiconiux sp. VKM Ac-2851]|uniref:penicillin-binding transpeptidase domain-containing protein n=1 Tax=Herbiconiux sp. VKM Ac-2851 TaxID=2739025 RepID=UPI0015672964|nr:penicillin-binding transpeptidase domain-containing protein [Herbiconiux sp. VKM Ac-2851]NQX34714.1 FtsW/RodA/SpoVE family cell cycle protein [Herbiconiux sp. VKM Ac-2851]
MIVGILAVSELRGGAAAVGALVATVVGCGAGMLLARSLGDAELRGSGQVFVIGLFAVGAGTLLRLLPLATGFEITVALPGLPPVVTSPLASIAMIVGAGCLLSVAAEAGRGSAGRVARGLLSRRTVAIAVALGSVLPFALASAHDLGPLVVVAVSIAVMTARATSAVLSLVFSGLVAIWIALFVINTVPIARDRLADVLEGTFQLDIARLAVAFGGLFWGGGIGTNSFAENIPLAENDHLAAYLAGSIGVVPFAALVAVLLWSFGRLLARMDDRVAPGTVIATGIVVAFAMQSCWAVAGSLGIVVLSGIPLPFVALSGSAGAAWGFGLGFVIRSGTSQPLGSHSFTTHRLVRSAVTSSSVVLPIAVVVAGTVLIASPPVSGVTGGYASYAARGALVSSDGVLLASTVNGERVLVGGEDYVETIGLVVPGNQYGLEAAVSSLTTCGGGGAAAVFLSGVAGPRCTPATVVTTLDSRVQAAVVAAVEASAPASALVLDGSTGNILAAYSSDGTPRPETSGLITGALSIDQVSPLLDDSPYFPAVLTDTFAPGSVFKVPVLAAAAEHGILDAEQIGEVGAEYPEAGGVTNVSGEPCPSSDIVTALELSCNTVTAAAAAALGQPDLLEELREHFAFDTGDPIIIDGLEIPGGTTGLKQQLSPEAFARTSVGLESVRTTLPQLALSYAMLVNEGAPVQAHLVQGVCDDGAREPSRIDPESSVLGTPLAAETVAAIREGMLAAAQSGTAAAIGDGLTIDDDRPLLAKTGSPDRSENGVTISDSLVVAILGDVVVVVRVEGTPSRPAPQLDAPATGVAHDVLGFLTELPEESSSQCGGNQG